MPDSVLFSGHPMFIPVAKQLFTQLQCVVYALEDGMVKQFRDTDTPTQPLESLADSGLRAQALRDAARVVAAAHNGPLPTTGLDPKLVKFLQANIPGFIFSRLGALSLLVHTLDRAKPKLVIVHNDVEPFTRLLALWAKARSVACLHVPHNVYMEHSGRGDVGSDVHDIITASHIACASQYQMDWYATRGQSKDRMRITGLPKNDRWLTHRVERGRARKILGIDPMRPLVLFADTWRQDTNLLGCHDGVEMTYFAFLKAAKQVPGLQVAILAHPQGQSLQWLAAQARAAGVTAFMSEMHLDILCDAADALIRFGPSNLFVEAANIQGLRLLSVGGFAGDDGIYSIPEVDDVNGQAQVILETLMKSLSGPAPDTSAFRVKYMGPIDNLAWRRVSDYAAELYNGKS